MPSAEKLTLSERTLIDIDCSPDTNSVFEEPWWLDAVAPDAWGAVRVERNGAVVGRMPWVRARRSRPSLLGQPPLTPGLGPWIDAGQGSPRKRLGTYFDIFGELLDGLPAASSHSQVLSPAVMSAMPLHWRGYDVRPGYTYRIDDLTDLDAVFAGMSSTTRRHIRRAQKRYRIRDDLGLDTLIRLSGESVSRSGGEAPSAELISRIDEAAARQGERRLLVAEDEDGSHHAAAYLVGDRRCVYYLLAGQTDESRSGGAPSLLMWEGIQHAAEVSAAFDFEGSMIPSIERFFRGFGGRPAQYFVATRRARWLSPLAALKASVRPGGS